MLTIKMLCDIEKLKRESRLPISLVQFLEKTFRELHEAYESETDIDQFFLSLHGPLYVLMADQNETESLKQIGFNSDESGIAFCQPEWVEKVDLGDHLVWRIGVMTDNDYLFQVILPVNEFGPDVESWLEAQCIGETSTPRYGDHQRNIERRAT